MTSEDAGSTGERSLVERIPLRRLGGLAVGVGLVTILVVVADPGAVARELATTQIRWYLLGGACFLGGYLPATLRWNHLQRTAGYPSDNMVAFEVLAVSYALNQLLPVNAGDVTRTALVDRYYEVRSHSELAGLVVVERAVDLCVVLGLLGAGSIAVASELVPVKTFATGAVLIGGLAVALAGLRWRAGTGPDFAGWLESVEWVPSAVAGPVDEFTAAVGRPPVRMLGVVSILGVVRWLFVVVGFLLLGRAVGTSVGPALAGALVGGMSLTSVLPLTPGGVGPGETIGVSVLVVGGVDEPAAVVLVFLQRSFGLLWMAPLGVLVYLVRAVSGHPDRR
ncbi:lysylphosphatidylglycerol synthase transmembrane domain-containing protein [Natrinema salsiterrestre]|uniref:Flippase-like domain-containing protein n=1 Tax=Natrinema salsiterrestre TaxID=2950540 RepID=A0A9Q4KY23_9EURY|nr:lysylphosphatidylglycerol synthase transmembrane domain-containing protein [Natrinema salsiterrestre]MDF9745838.1 flippase-like domain-containing protein [Natrinema salsiterrestre]